MLVSASHTSARFYTITHSLSGYLQHRHKTNLYMCLLWTAIWSDGCVRMQNKMNTNKANTVVSRAAVGCVFVFAESQTLSLRQPSWKWDKGGLLAASLVLLSLPWRILQKAAGLSEVEKERMTQAQLLFESPVHHLFFLGAWMRTDGTGKKKRMDQRLFSLCLLQHSRGKTEKHILKTVNS